MSTVTKSEIDWKAVGRGIPVLRGIEIDQAQLRLNSVSARGSFHDMSRVGAKSVQ
jgi:hypothetical protein